MLLCQSYKQNNLTFKNVLNFLAICIFSFITLPINTEINFFIPIKKFFKNLKKMCCCENLEKIDKKEKKKEIKIKKFYDEMNLKGSIMFLPIIYSILLSLFGVLLLIWGYFWTSPSLIYSSKQISFFKNKKPVTNIYNNSQFCKFSSGPFNIIQLSALPVLLNFFHRGYQYLEPLNDIQKSNIKIFLKYLFEDNAYKFFIDFSSLSQWNLIISLPYENPISKNLTEFKILVFGSYRTPFDWVMFVELFIQKHFTLLVQSLIPGYSIVTQSLKVISNIFTSILFTASGTSSYTETIAELLYKKYSKIPKVDLMVGHGIGGYFAKYFSLKESGLLPSISFESMGVVGSEISKIKPSKKINPLITNIHNYGLFSSSEPFLDHNYKRLGRKTSIKADDAFTSFCSTIAQCSSNNYFDSLCLENGKDYLYLLESYGRNSNFQSFRINYVL